MFIPDKTKELLSEKKKKKRSWSAIKKCVVQHEGRDKISFAQNENLHFQGFHNEVSIP